MPIQALLSSNDQILPLRTRYRSEAGCQIVHDSIHARVGWARSYLLHVDGLAAGFGSIAIAGPWTDKPTVYEFYVLPEYRSRAFELFEALLAASEARFFEVQTSDVLLTMMLHAYGREIASESIVFRDELTTSLTISGAVLSCVTPEEDLQLYQQRRRGCADWHLELDGVLVAKGGLCFHYNVPYADVYMETLEPFRRRGLGSYLVQELKRVCYERGAIPAARCNPGNVASRRTLQRAGFEPYAHILNGVVANAKS